MYDDSNFRVMITKLRPIVQIRRSADHDSVISNQELRLVSTVDKFALDSTLTLL